MKTVLPPLEDRLQTLQQERTEAEEEAANRDLRERYNRVTQKKAVLEQAIENISSTKKLPNEDIEKIRNAFSTVETLRTSISAGKLAISFTAMKDLQLTVQKDIEPEEQKIIRKTESLHIEAGGKIRLQHEDWRIDATSGTGNVEKVIEEYNTADKALKELLGICDVSSLQQAIQVNQAYEQHRPEVETAKENLSAELGNYSYEEIERDIQQIGQKKPNRPLEQILGELFNVQGDCDSKNRNWVNINSRLKNILRHMSPRMPFF